VTRRKALYAADAMVAVVVAMLLGAVTTPAAAQASDAGIVGPTFYADSG
jgi:hypothetical protein